MVLGIDIGGTRCKAALVSEAGMTIRSAQAPTGSQPERFAQNLNNMLHDLQQGQPAVAAAGIGCKGIIDVHSTKVLTLPGALHHLEGQQLSAIIAAVSSSNPSFSQKNRSPVRKA